MVVFVRKFKKYYRAVIDYINESMEVEHTHNSLRPEEF